LFGNCVSPFFEETNNSRLPPWDKHDTKDSANVADLICQGKFLYYEYPDPKMQDLRTQGRLGS
jgi:hypothetical protein